MKIRMLVGACGLALAGTAIASPTMLQRDRMDKTIEADQMSARQLHNSEAGDRVPTRRSLVNATARGPVYVYRDTIDGLDADQMLPNEVPGLYIRQVDLTEPATYEGDFILGGQLGVDNQAWASISWGGIVDNAVAISDMDANTANGEYNGPIGGPDPMGMRGGMLNVQGSSVQRADAGPSGGFFTYQNFHNLYTGTTATPLFMEIDIYKRGSDTFQWIRPVSFTEGLLTSNIQMGGWNGPGSGLFEPLAQRYGDPELLEGVVVLANVPDDPDSGEFVTGPYQIPEEGWFTLGMLLDPANGMAFFVKDSVTSADTNMDGTPDYVMPDNTVTMMRMFEEYGYGLEEGWVQVVPGTMDDPMTPDEIEGVGFALNDVDEPTDNLIFNGNVMSSVFAGISLDAAQLIHGVDPTTAQLPTYVIQDWWWDDYRIRGIEFIQPDPIPTYRIPYVDDLERWNLGPMALQGGRWFEVTNARAQVVASQNHTQTGTGSANVGMESQSLNLQNRVQDDVYQVMTDSNLPTTPRVNGLAGDPAVVRAAVRFQSDFLSYGIMPVQLGLVVNTAPTNQPNGDDLSEWMGRVWTSCIDSMGFGDGQVYVRQRKPIGTDIAGGEFDPLMPLDILSGPMLTPDQESDQNTEYINVLAAPAGMSSFSMPVNQWHVVSVEGEPGTGGVGANGEENLVRIYVAINDADGNPDGEFVELFPNGDAMASWSTNAISPNEVQFASSNSFNAGFVNLYIDDIELFGPTQTDTLVPLAAEFADDSPWELPFSDDLDTYEQGRAAGPQGFANHRLGFMPIGDPDVTPIPNDWDEIEFIDGAAPLMDGDPVRVYVIDNGGTSFSNGEFVAVSDDILREYDLNTDIYGVFDPMADATDWYILDSVGGSEIDRGTWRLANATGLDTFDSMTMTDMGARYSYRQNFRYGGSIRESEFVSAAAEGIDTARGTSRGDVVKMINKGNVRDFSDPNGGQRLVAISMFNGFFPLADAVATEDVATLSFDFYVGQSSFATGCWADINGGTADGGDITGLSFGGLGFQSGNQDAMTGLNPFLATGNFGYQIANPLLEPGAPEAIWVDSGVPVPTQTWFTVDVSVNGDSEFSISVNGSEIASGVAIDAAEITLETSSLDNISFNRNGFGENDGEPTEGIVQIIVDGPSDMASVGGGVGAYHFFEIDDVDDVNSTSIPQIIGVDPVAGTPLEDAMMMPLPPRDLASTDVIAVVNIDPDTMAPFSSPLVNDRWEVVEDDGMGGFTTVALGEWRARGLPGLDGAGTSAAPAGGIVNGATPAYNAMAPFEDILLANYHNVAAVSILPSDTWYVDNFSLTLATPSPCPADLSMDGTVNSGDLAILLAAWGPNPGSPADLSMDGTVNSGDLAILLAAWGPCP